MAITSEGWLKAQYAVLGAALIDGSQVPRVMSETCERDYSGACRSVYQAMRRLYLSGAVYLQSDDQHHTKLLDDSHQ